MTQYAGSRFGPDTAPRIMATTEVLMEASELPPVPMYQPLVPFYPSLTNGDSAGAGGTTSSTALALAASDSGPASWKKYPDRLDLYCYQGDDVQVPLYFQDPSDVELDMSSWEWTAQVHWYHAYYAPQLVKLSVKAEYILPEDPTDPDNDPTIGSTLVTLFLPRMWNRYCGVYAWDIYSTSPYQGPLFDKPDNVAPEDWLQDQVKTWLYGRMYVVPRVTTTDWLPPKGALPVQSFIVMPTGLFGPNGRVP